MSNFRAQIAQDWERWCLYKKQQHRFTYKSEDSKNTALKHLYEYSGGNIQRARLVIDTAIGRGWTGFHPLKGAEATRNTYKGIKEHSEERVSADAFWAKAPKKEWEKFKATIKRIGKSNGATDQSYHARRKYKKFRLNEMSYGYQYVCNLIYEISLHPQMEKELKYMNNVMLKETKL